MRENYNMKKSSHESVKWFKRKKCSRTIQQCAIHNFIFMYIATKCLTLPATILLRLPPASGMCTHKKNSCALKRN